jgi:hypothetical protein
LNQSQAFNQALDAAGEHDAVGFLDVAAFRDAGVAAPLYRTPTENVFAEMLLGGIIATLAETPSAVAGLDVLEDAVRFDVSVPRRTAWVEGREHYFGEDGLATAPPLRHLEGSLLTLSSYRDLSQMWLLAPNLMNDRANEQLAKADTTLTTFFSGRDFGQDILGALEPELRLVVTRQTFAPSQPTPGIKLPAFALEARMRDPETASTELRRVFQSFVGFINVVGAMEGQPQLDLGMIESDSATLVTATYIRPSDTPDSEALPIQFNFSPTLAFAGRRLVLSSTTELAETLIHARDGGQRPKAGVNTQAVLQAGTLNEVLRDNRSQLVAQNMIEKGHSPEQAEAEIDVLLQLIDLARDASMQLRSGEDRLAVEVEVRLDDS